MQFLQPINISSDGALILVLSLHLFNDSLILFVEVSKLETMHAHTSLFFIFGCLFDTAHLLTLRQRLSKPTGIFDFHPLPKVLINAVIVFLSHIICMIMTICAWYCNINTISIQLFFVYSLFIDFFSWMYNTKKDFIFDTYFISTRYP